MIENDNLALKKLKDFREGKIKQGLGIGVKEFDKHFVFKESEFNGILGLDNVGKTFWLMYYLLCQAKINRKKFIIWSGENNSWQLKADLIQMWMGTKYGELIKEKIPYYNREISKFFKFIDNTKLYNHKELFNIFANTDADGCVLDPYTAINHDRRVNQFDRNYNFCNDAREFCNKTKKTLFVCLHPHTEAARRVYPQDHTLNGYIQPPRKSDTEGGQVFPNRLDNLLVCHRYTNSPELWMLTEIHVLKVKNKITGGTPTMLNEPLRFDYNNGLGFTLGGVNPLNK